MSLDPVSVAVGILAAYAFSAALVAVLIFFARRAADKQRDEAVEQLIVRVAVRCIERPTDARVN